VTPDITVVVAAAENGVIGRGGQLPWRIPSDLRLFRRLTMGKPVIMGRKTYQSIGKPLDGRDTIVISRDPAFSPAGVIVARSVSEAVSEGRRLATSRRVDEVIVAGGADVFQATLPIAQRIYLTRVHAMPEGDTYLPPLDSDDWREISRQALPRGDRDEFSCTLLVLERAKKFDDAVGSA
jgi:dihydrofolate reductase